MADFHIFKIKKRDLLYFSRSGRFYAVDKKATRMLNSLLHSNQNVSIEEEVEKSIMNSVESSGSEVAEFQELLKQESEMSPPFSSIVKGSKKKNYFHSISIYVSQFCNMSCLYCWNQNGTFGDTPKLMSCKTSKLVTHTIKKLLESSEADEMSINFFGGEPLLNFDAIKLITLELLEQAALLRKTIHFNIDTNGCFLEDDKAEFIAQYFSEVAVSIDGRKEIHDLQRISKSKEGTWERIVSNLSKFPKSEILILRGTLTDFSGSYLETFCYLLNFGIKKIQLEYCHNSMRECSLQFNKLCVNLQRQRMELMEFIDWHVDILKKYKLSKEVPFTPHLLSKVVRLYRGERYSKPCGAGTTMLAIDCHGNLFPCLAFVGHPEFTMGRVESHKYFTSLSDPFANYHVDAQIKCRSCWARYDCAGGCFARHLEITGNIKQPSDKYCSSIRQDTELYLYALARLREECHWHLEQMPI